eukprot:742893-Amphidinium_carterae.1
MQVVLAAVALREDALVHSSRLTTDREFMLAAVSVKGNALEFACEDLKRDRDVVMAAVTQLGSALRFAGKELKKDREVVKAAIARQTWPLQFAADSLLEDTTFAVEARQDFHFFRIVAMSGRSCMIAYSCELFSSSGTLMNMICQKLDLDRGQGPISPVCDEAHWM